jgi:1-acyl-sn-glycerol-3-phosphate acyltransferase
LRAQQSEGVLLRGSRLAHALMRAFGWRAEFDGRLPGAQGVVIVYPHTSNWDFVWGLLAKWSLGIPVVFWAKETLFRVPLIGRWLRSLGGLPVERSAPHGAVAAMAQRLTEAHAQGRFMWLALTPEGTRSYKPAWRSGFYQVALQAEVPLGVAYFDYRQRRVVIAGFLRLSGDEVQDLAAIAALLAPSHGKRPQQAAPIKLAP